MRDSLLQCRQTLRVLRLGTCGRCVADSTLEALAKDGGVPRLEMASLAGEAGCGVDKAKFAGTNVSLAMFVCHRCLCLTRVLDESK